MVPTVSCPGCVFTKNEPSAPDALRYERQCPLHAPLAGNYWDCSPAPAPCQQRETQYTFEGVEWRLKVNKKNLLSFVCVQIMTHFTMQDSTQCTTHFFSVVVMPKKVLNVSSYWTHHILLTDFSCCSPAGILVFVFFAFSYLIFLGRCADPLMKMVVLRWSHVSFDWLQIEIPNRSISLTEKRICAKCQTVV